MLYRAPVHNDGNESAEARKLIELIAACHGVWVLAVLSRGHSLSFVMVVLKVHFHGPRYKIHKELLLAVLTRCLTYKFGLACA